MSEIGLAPPAEPRRRGGWLNRLFASPRVQSWAAALPIARSVARRDGEAMFDLLAGFCHTQILTALVELGVLERLLDGPLPEEEIARRCGLPPERARVLLRGGDAIGMIRKSRSGYRLTRPGAALLGVPGLTAMISHNRTLYRDLADPSEFFRGGGETELAAFWPYVFGAGAAEDPRQAERYSALMADTQSLVAEETLRTVSLRGVRLLMDVGGGTGAFLAAAGARHPGLRLRLVDLPAVAPAAAERFAREGLSERAEIVPASFRDAPLPAGADAISLVRVLYDHSDETVIALLRAAHEALAPGGRLIVSEPMAGAGRPERAGDAYFALYTMAMGTGRARTSGEIAALCRGAGFASVRCHRAGRPFVTSVVTAERGAVTVNVN